MDFWLKIRRYLVDCLIREKFCSYVVNLCLEPFVSYFLLFFCSVGHGCTSLWSDFGLTGGWRKTIFCTNVWGISYSCIEFGRPLAAQAFDLKVYSNVSVYFFFSLTGLQSTVGVMGSIWRPYCRGPSSIQTQNKLYSEFCEITNENLPFYRIILVSIKILNSF